MSTALLGFHFDVDTNTALWGSTLDLTAIRNSFRKGC